MLRHLFSLPSQKRAVGELFLAAILWGFGFIASRWALTGFGPSWITALRFAIAFAFGLPFLLGHGTLRGQAGRDQFLLAALPGFLIGAALLLQIAGLRYTTVTRSGFITSLYVVFVPLLELPLFRRRIPVIHALWVATALAGTALICQLQGGQWNRGDVLTLAGSLCAALHILQLEAVADRIQSSLVFNVYQSFWAGLFPCLVALATERWPSGPIPELAWAGLLVIGVFVQLVAFLIQVRTQRVLPPSLVSMLFLLESPFAALFAFLCFGEQLKASQWLGAALILASAAGTVRSQSDPLPDTAAA